MSRHLRIAGPELSGEPVDGIRATANKHIRGMLEVGVLHGDQPAMLCYIDPDLCLASDIQAVIRQAQKIAADHRAQARLEQQLEIKRA